MGDHTVDQIYDIFCTLKFGWNPLYQSFFPDLHYNKTNVEIKEVNKNTKSCS